MANVDNMRQMSAEMARLARMTGNCGRVIDRFLTRVVQDDEVEVCIEPPKSWRLLDLACFVVYVNRHLTARRDVGGEVEGATPYEHAVSVFPWLSTGSVSIIVSVKGVEKSVAARQLMLKGVSATLDMMTDLVTCVLEQDSSEVLRGMFVGEQCETSEEQLVVFDEVVRGLYTRVEALAPRLIALANTLNSQVASVAPAGTDLKVEFIDAEEQVHDEA